MVKRLTNPLAGREPPLGNLLAAAARRLGAELDAGVAAAGFDDLRAAHAPIFQVIEPAGSRPSELAERTGLTKQAIGEAVRYLEKRGYVESAVDSVDRRARIVALTTKGWAAVDAGVEVMSRFDTEIAAWIDADEIAALRSTLMKIIAGAGSTYSKDHVERTAVMRIE